MTSEARRSPYAITVFVSSLLLFLVQPMIGRQILPVFGGVAAVWAACLVFFQCVLLLGYLYAHLSNTRFAPRRQFAVHAALLGLSLLLISVPQGMGPVRELAASSLSTPNYACFTLLARTIGLPFFILSSTGPLLQSWYSATGMRALPYRLFALSNLGSLIALLLYPLLLERVFDLHIQFAIWRVGYVLFAIACCTAGIPFLRSRIPERAIIQPRRVALQTRWILLAACSSAFLLAVTNVLSQSIAPIPLLWIGPLIVYLLSFVICFDTEEWFRPAVYRVLTPVALTAIAWEGAGTGLKVMPAMLIALGSLFVVCMFCHGQLARMKPPASELTSFYLSLAAGGAAGGLLTGLVAPVVFRTYFELNIVIALCLTLVLRYLFDYRSKAFLFSAGLVTVLSLGFFGGLNDGRTIFRGRSFYGVLSVTETRSATGTMRTLLHGKVAHGGERLSRGTPEPAFYYGPESGIGLVLRSPFPFRRVAIIGLGVGTVAAYGASGDYYRFYEIDPQVISLARTFFTFLRTSKAAIDVVAGDGRLSLERDRDPPYDVLVVDAFSGDSIPVHLLTAEAFDSYFRHLTPDGILAIHVSNQYLDLRPVIADLADRNGRTAVQVESRPDPSHGDLLAEWILVGGKRLFVDELVRNGNGVLLHSGHGRLWTDQYSNLLSVLR